MTNDIKVTNSVDLSMSVESANRLIEEIRAVYLVLLKTGQLEEYNQLFVLKDALAMSIK